MHKHESVVFVYVCVCVMYVCVCKANEWVKVTHHYSIAGRQNRVIAGKKGLVGGSIATRSRGSGGWGNWNPMGRGLRSRFEWRWRWAHRFWFSYTHM